ncbi:MAG: peptidoglycan-binding domain-containing protein [Pseudomonadota bacterium]
MRICFFGFLILLLPTALSANEYVRCIQNQLAFLGYNPGPADGVLGSRTRSALEELNQTSENAKVLSELPELGDETAQDWCAAIGDSYSDASRFAPRERKYPVDTDSVLGEFGQVFVEDIYFDVVSFYEDGWGIKQSSPHFVFGSENPTFLSASLGRSLAKSGYPVPRNLNSRMREVCRAGNYVSGIVYYSSIALCWKPLSSEYRANPDAWARDLRMELGALLTHEYFHFIQHVLSKEKERGGKTADGQMLMGPAWLLEGTAEYFELRYWRSRRPNFFGPSIASLQKIYREHRVTLKDLDAFGTVRTLERYRIALLAVELLAARAGEGALIDFWRRLGAGQTREAAFLQTFGVELSAFKADFSELGSNYSAATKFTKSID